MVFKKLLLSIITFLTVFIYPKFGLAAKVETVFFKGEDPCQYWKSIFDFGVAAAGILTVALLVIGGIYYLVSFGQEEKLKKAKDVMTGAVAGLILTLLAWGLFYVLAPTLLKCEFKPEELVVKPPPLPEPEKIISDPCAGIPDDKLFHTKEDCEARGGSKGGRCEGTCVQIPLTEPGKKEEGGKSEEQTKRDDFRLAFWPLNLIRNKFSLIYDAKAIPMPVQEPDTTFPSKEEQESQQQKTLQEQWRAGKWCCIGGKCTRQDIIAAAQRYLGTCFGPCHCSWFVSKVLADVGCLNMPPIISSTRLEKTLIGMGWQMQRETEYPRKNGKYQGGEMEGVQAGDIVFVDHPEDGETISNTHVGIYVGGDRIIHSGGGMGYFCRSKAPECPAKPVKGSELLDWCSDCNKIFPDQRPGTGRFSPGLRHCTRNQCVQYIKYNRDIKEGNARHPTHYVSLPQ